MERKRNQEEGMEGEGGGKERDRGELERQRERDRGVRDRRRETDGER